jgi:ABC-type dipeptide/oligopeptide/nickel transport system permease component
MLLSLTISIIFSLSLAYLINIFSLHKLRSIIENASIALQAIPLFLIATLIMIYLTNDVVGIKLIEIPLNSVAAEADFFSILSKGVYNYLPAVLCSIIVDTLILSRLLLKNIDEEKNQYYIEVLKTRNISNTDLYQNHIFPNVLIPFGTLILGSIPASLAGTLTLEIIFNISGMGRLIYESILAADWNIVYTIVMLFLVIGIIILKINDALINYFDRRSLK